MEDSSITQFISITGASPEVASSLLEACNGDVNLAVSMHLDNGGPSENTHDTATSSQTYEERHGVRAPIPQKQGVLIEEQALPRRSFRRRNLPNSVFDPFQDYSMNNRPAGGASSIDPNEDKKKTLANLFRPPIELMFKGDFAEARIAGQNSGKWLLVNLQDSSEFSCQVLNRDLWSNTRVKRIINEHFVFWQIQKITDEGIRFGSLYSIHTYPAIVIIDPRTGEKMEQWSHLSVQEFISKVDEFNSINQLGENQLHVPTICNTSEEDQLEAAIKASLADSQESNHIIISSSSSDGLPSEDEQQQPSISDDEDSDQMDYSTGPSFDSWTNDRLSRKRLATRQLGKHVEGRVTRAKTRRLEESAVIKSDLSDDLEEVRISDRTESMVHQPQRSSSDGISTVVESSSTVGSASSSESSTARGGHEVCQVLIRLPDGRRMVRSYHTEAPIKELFNCLNQEGFPLSQYEVMSTFPRSIISSLPMSTTFSEAGLCPRQTIYVQMAD